MDMISINRRFFLKRAGMAVLAGYVGGSILVSCTTDELDNLGGNNSNNNGTPSEDSAEGITISGNTITIQLDKVAELQNQGGWLLIVGAQTLVVNTGSNIFNALTSVCTHSNCDRNWTFSNSRFTCTCHGSQFDIDGSVLQGPANRPLNSFNTRFEEGVLTISK
jgi:cytochrome b6-f complex iron-sulfur subunit